MGLEGGKTWLRRTVEKIETRNSAANPDYDPEDSGMTIGEILQTEIDSKAFGTMLEGMRDSAEAQEVALRLRAGTPEPDDLKKLEKYRNEYVDRKKRAEDLSAALDQHVGFLRSTSASLNALCGTFGEGAYLSVTRRGLFEKVMANPAEFKRIETQFKKLLDVEKGADDVENSMDARISKFCAKHELSDGQISKLLDEPDAAKRTAAIQGVLRGEMWFLHRWADWGLQKIGLPSSVKEAKSIAAIRDEVEAYAANREVLAKKSGNLLAALVSKNPELRNALATVVPGSTPEVKDGIATTMSYKESRSGTISQKDFKSEWEKFLERRAIDDFASRPDAMKNALRSTFTREYAAKNRTDRKGFWASIFDIMFAKKIESKKMQDMLN